MPIITTLSAVFADGDRSYTFMVHRRLAQTLKEGDAVLVDTTAGLRVAYVKSVHEKDSRPKNRPEIKWKWAFQKVDVQRLKDLKTLEDMTD